MSSAAGNFSFSEGELVPLATFSDRSEASLRREEVEPAVSGYTHAYDLRHYDSSAWTLHPSRLALQHDHRSRVLLAVSLELLSPCCRATVLVLPGLSNSCRACSTPCLGALRTTLRAVTDAFRAGDEFKALAALGYESNLELHTLEQWYLTFSLAPPLEVILDAPSFAVELDAAVLTFASALR